MSFGSASLGSPSLGGTIVTLGTFFSPSESLTVGTYRRSIEYAGAASFFQVIQQQEVISLGDPRLAVRIYSHNDPGESPQLQTSGGEANFSQSIIGAARFVVVELELLFDLSPTGVLITGSEYFQ